jgi:hypothetical protein
MTSQLRDKLVDVLAKPVSMAFLLTFLGGFFLILASVSSAPHRLNTGRCDQMKFLAMTISNVPIVSPASFPAMSPPCEIFGKPLKFI